MPQIGWFEILIIVVLAILIIGPKDFPIMLKKIGSWIGSAKRYFTDVQKNIYDMETERMSKSDLRKSILQSQEALDLKRFDSSKKVFNGSFMIEFEYYKKYLDEKILKI